MKTFRAPWGWPLIGISVFSAVLCIGLAAMLSATTYHPRVHFAEQFIFSFIVPIFPLGTVLIAALFTIRGYTIMPDAILVYRLLWATRLPREGLVSATSEPKVMHCSLRICGNGGMFSFSGWFWSKRLGRYKAYVTDLNRTVVLRWENRTAVISPEDPEGFARELMA